MELHNMAISISRILSQLRIPIPVALGGTGGVTQAAAQTGLGLRLLGIGAPTAVININDTTLVSGTYQAASTGGGTYPSGFTNGTVAIACRNLTPYRCTQTLTSDADGKMWTRANNDIWTAWTPVVRQGDFGSNGGSAITLASDVNWDTIITPGDYFIPSATGASGPTNTGNSFVVKVQSTSVGFKQTANHYGGSVFWTRSSSGAWGTWTRTYDNASVIGPVSQVAGLPTGSLIEKGSNAQGSYVRYADGTQICWITFTTLAVNVANGSVFNSLAIAPGAYPAAFSSTPTVTDSCGPFGASTGVFWAGLFDNPTQTSWGGWVGMAPLATGGYSTIRLTAIGRWY